MAKDSRQQPVAALKEGEKLHALLYALESSDSQNMQSLGFDFFKRTTFAKVTHAFNPNTRERADYRLR